MTRTVPLDIAYIGEWKTPWWDGDENKGEMRRIGFEATARIDRHDFGVSWQDELPDGGVVVSNEIELTLDVEAILLEDLERTGAIDYYMPARAGELSCDARLRPRHRVRLLPDPGRAANRHRRGRPTGPRACGNGAGPVARE